MKKLPGALFIVDPRKERNAIAEARKLNIPIVAIVDTNCDPDEIDYIIRQRRRDPSDPPHLPGYGRRRPGGQARR